MHPFKGSYINNQWTPYATPTQTYIRYSPAQRDHITFSLNWNPNSVDAAVSAAKKASSSWKRLSLDQRTEAILRLKTAFQKRAADFANAIAWETGKPLWEAKTEASALISKIDVTLSDGLAAIHPVNPTGLNGRIVHRPLGVLAVIAPFNFPVHLANGHIIPALLAGNTLVVKPSPLTSLSMQVYFECVEEANLPPGVINLVHGDADTGERLTTHPHISGILFTGSYRTGVAIARTNLKHPGKMLALELGGKNTTIILNDANIDQAVAEIAQAAFLTTGQRCSATSRLAVHSSRWDEMVDRLKALVSTLSIGHPIDEDPFMGSLVNQEAYDRFLHVQSDNESGNLSPIVAGGPTRPDLNGFYVRPGLWEVHTVDPKGSHQGTEIFGPDICLYRFETDQEAVQFANATSYGLAMSIFTADEERFHELSYDLDTGILNLNRSTVGASGRLPFGGVKNSGNHRPSAITAPLYCSYPQAQLHNAASWDPKLMEQGALSKLHSK